MQSVSQVHVLISNRNYPLFVSFAGFQNGTQRRVALERVCYRTFGRLNNSQNDNIIDPRYLVPSTNTSIDTKDLNNGKSVRKSVNDDSLPYMTSQPNNAPAVNTSRSRSCSPSNSWWRKNCSQETDSKLKVRITVGKYSHLLDGWSRDSHLKPSCPMWSYG